MLVLIIVLQIALILGAIFIIFKYGALGLSHNYDVPLIETPREYLPKIAEALEITAGDVVYDLGSGDGRVILYLAKHFPAARFVGIERNPLLYLYSRLQCTHVNASFSRTNFFDADFRNATKIYAYLQTKPLNDLYDRGKLKNVLLVSRAFRLHSTPPTSSIRLSSNDGSHGEHMLYVYEL